MGMRERFIRLLIDANNHRITKCLSHEKCDTCQNRDSYAGECQTPFMADYLIANDVVPVVRCKDCKHYDNTEGIQWCHLNSKFLKYGTDWHSFPEDGFCSYGEMKDGDQS